LAASSQLLLAVKVGGRAAKTAAPQLGSK